MLSFASLVLLVVAAAAVEEKYTTKFDKVDLDSITHNDRVMKIYYDCLMGTSTCTSDGAALKRILPDALETECVKCSELQKARAEKVVNYIIENKPDQWKELESVYDPAGNYRSKYELYKLRKNTPVKE